MQDQKLSGNIELRIINNGMAAKIPKLYPYNEDGSIVTTKQILEMLQNAHITYGINHSIIEYYINKTQVEGVILNDIYVASAKVAQKKGAKILKLNKTAFAYYDSVIWGAMEEYFRTINPNAPCLFPENFVYFQRGEIIGSLVIANDNENGINISGEELTASRVQSLEIKAGENIYLDENKNNFVAGASGYFYMKESALILFSPFYISEDKMSLIFLNLKRSPELYPTKDEVVNYIKKMNIRQDKVKVLSLVSTSYDEHITLVKGKEPGIGSDAVVELYVTKTNKVVHDDKDKRIDFRDIYQFSTVPENELLAKKVIAVKGEDGEDIFGNRIPSRMPKDIAFRNGPGTKRIETEKEIEIRSLTEGIIDIKNDIISVYPNMNVMGDVDFNSGNINSKVNVHITGNVLSGFKVISEKNIYIGGTVEENCYIEAGGELYIKGGATGESTKLICGSDMSIKFIEGCDTFCKGALTVQKYIMNANVECSDRIFISGAGINLNERGAIIDSEIKVRNALFVPTVGNDVGSKTIIHFAYDKVLYTKIENMLEICNNLKASIQELNDDFEVDITSANIWALIKDFAKPVKDRIVNAIQEKNKIDNKLKMMEGILNKEMETKKELLKAGFVEISKKVFPSLVLYCDGLQKTVDTVQPASKFYFDLHTRMIERSRYLSGEQPQA